MAQVEFGIVYNRHWSDGIPVKEFAELGEQFGVDALWCSENTFSLFPRLKQRLGSSLGCEPARGLDGGEWATITTLVAPVSRPLYAATGPTLLNSRPWPSMGLLQPTFLSAFQMVA